MFLGDIFATGRGERAEGKGEVKKVDAQIGNNDSKRQKTINGQPTPEHKW